MSMDKLMEEEAARFAGDFDTQSIASTRDIDAIRTFMDRNEETICRFYSTTGHLGNVARREVVKSYANLFGIPESAVKAQKPTDYLPSDQRNKSTDGNVKKVQIEALSGNRLGLVYCSTSSTLPSSVQAVRLGVNIDGPPAMPCPKRISGGKYLTYSKPLIQAICEGLKKRWSIDWDLDTIINTFGAIGFDMDSEEFINLGAYRPPGIAGVPMCNAAVMSWNQFSTPDMAAQQKAAMIHFVGNNALTSGTGLGQANRYAAVMKEGLKHRPALDCNQLGDIRQLLVDQFTDATVEGKFSVRPISPANTAYHIQRTADSGPAYWALTGQSVKKSSTVVLDFAFCNRLYNDLKECDSKDDASAKVAYDGIIAYLKTLQSIVLEKPKFEVTTVENITKKTRNIYVFNCPAQYLLQAAVRTCTSKRPAFSTFMWSKAGHVCHSLYGFSALYGKLRYLLETMRLDPTRKRVSGCFYSDNFYIFDKTLCVLYSLDVAKMEGSSSPLEAKMALQWFFEPLRELEGVHFYNCMVELGSYMCHDNLAWLGDMLYQVSGLMSGSATTLTVNHLRMACMCDRILDYYEKNATALDGLVAGYVLPLEKMGFTSSPFSLEVQVVSAQPNDPNSFKVRSDIASQPLSTSLLPSSVQPWSVVRLDLLGNDAVWVYFDFQSPMLSRVGPFSYRFDPNDRPLESAPTEKWKLCSALSYDRCMKAMCFRTKLVDPGKKVEDLEAAAVVHLEQILIIIFTMYQLVWVGGYAYPEAISMAKASITWACNDYVTLSQSPTVKMKDVIAMLSKDLKLDQISEIVGESFSDVDELISSSSSMLNMLRDYSLQKAKEPNGVPEILDTFFAPLDRYWVVWRFHNPHGAAFYGAAAKRRGVLRVTATRVKLPVRSTNEKKRARESDVDEPLP